VTGAVTPGRCAGIENVSDYGTIECNETTVQVDDFENFVFGSLLHRRVWRLSKR